MTKIAKQKIKVCPSKAEETKNPKPKTSKYFLAPTKNRKLFK